jgi:hypothetical protein
MEPERHEILFRHYKADRVRFAYRLKKNLLEEDVSEREGGGYTDYLLKLEPDDRFHGPEKGVLLGVGDFDISLLIDPKIAASVESLVGLGKPFGRIYFERKGWGKKARYSWFYQHEVDLPKESESGLALYLDGRLRDIVAEVPLEPDRPVDLKLRLKRSEDLIHLATILVREPETISSPSSPCEAP